MQHGPGTENAYGGIAQAYSESIPILVVPGGFPRRTAQVGANYYATREMRGIAKSAESITTPDEVVNVMRRAFSHLRNGRGGPAIVEVPQDLWNEEVPEPLDYKPVVATRCGPDPDAVRERRQAARQGQAAGHLRRPGRALGEGLEAAARARRASRARRWSPASKARARFPKRIRCRSVQAASRCRSRCATSSTIPT